jgi:class 3 adenylate cyclase
VALVRPQRSVAVVFADISGSTAIYEQLGDIAGHQLIRGCLGIMQEEVEAHGGQVVKAIGDELMCTFPDVVSALGAATGMQQQVQELAAPGGRRMSLRIGVHHGLALLEEGGDVYGQAVNVAARVVGLARAGQILITKDCCMSLPALTRNRIREIDSFTLRGRTAEITILEVMWRGAEQNTTDIPSITDYASRAESLLRFSYDGRSLTVPHRASPFIVGRDIDCHLVIDGTKVSRQHAIIEWRRGKYVLIDRSTNGTFVKPESERTVQVKREELFLHGRGLIGFGELAGETILGSVQYECE